MMKLKINKEANNFAVELEKDYPSLKSYHELISKEVGCPWEEVVCLDVHPDNAIGDEEGWQIEAFFPRGIDPETSMINDDYNTKDFSVGSVVRLKHDGATFVAETNASPWTVYANPKTIEVW